MEESNREKAHQLSSRMRTALSLWFQMGGGVAGGCSGGVRSRGCDMGVCVVRCGKGYVGLCLCGRICVTRGLCIRECDGMCGSRGFTSPVPKCMLGHTHPCGQTDACKVPFINNKWILLHNEMGTSMHRHWT